MASIPWQQDSIAPGMFKSSEIISVIGRVMKYDLKAGTPLLSTMLLSEGETISSAGSPWALSIPPGMVAVSVPVDRLSSVTYAPWPGDHVNVIVSMLFVDVDTDFQSILPNKSGVVNASGPPNPLTLKPDPLTVEIANETYGKTLIDPVLGQAVSVVPNEPQRPRMVSHMLLQDVVVLQVGEFPLEEEETTSVEPTPTPLPEETEEAEAEQGPKMPDVMTLIVRPQDAVALNYIMFAQYQLAAQISLVLRGASDSSRENTLPVTLGFLLEQYQVPVPAKLPYSLNPRIDGLAPGLVQTPNPNQ